MEDICLDNMKVSIITPIYGVEKYIEKCAESLFSQTYEDCEFIFVNDCTKDNSVALLKEVMQKYSYRIENVKIISHSSNQGLACARNTGVRFATGEFVMHVDSDDTIESNAVELCVKKAIENNSDAVIFGMRHIRKTGDIVEHVCVPNKHQDYIKQLITRKALVCMCGGLYRRSLYTDNNVWAIPGLNMGEDYSTKPRLLYYAKNVVALDLPLYNYNHLNESSYTKSFNTNSIDNLQKAIEVLTSFFTNCIDYNDYKDALKEAALSSKIILLKSWAITKSTEQDFERIKYLFDDIDVRYIDSLIDRFILILALKDQRTLMKMFVKFGVKFKSFFR